MENKIIPYQKIK